MSKLYIFRFNGNAENGVSRMKMAQRNPTETRKTQLDTIDKEGQKLKSIDKVGQNLNQKETTQLLHNNPIQDGLRTQEI